MIPNKYSVEERTPRGNKVHPTLEDAKSGYARMQKNNNINYSQLVNKLPKESIFFYKK